MSGARQKIVIKTILVQKVVYIQSSFAFVFLNSALPYQLVTMQGKVLKLETFMAIRIDFINDFTYLLHFYFSENAKVRKTARRKNLIFNNF